MSRMCQWVCVWVAVLLLASCGGGGGGGGSGGGGIATTTPQDISGAMPYATSVGGGDSYYVVSGLNPSQFYAIYAYAATGNIALYGYSDSGFLLVRCSSDRPGTSDEACSTTPDANGKIYIRVNGANTGGGASFTLKLMPAALAQGSSAAPLDISASLPYQGVTLSTSYYVVGGLTPGQRYTVTLDSVLYNPELSVYQRKFFDYADCTSSNAAWTNESCDMAANFEGRLYIKVDANNGVTLSSIGAYFRISVTPAAGTELYFQGYSDAPLDLTGKLPYAAQVNRHESYYRVTGLTPGTRYEVRMNNPTADNQMWVFQDATFVNALCSVNYYFSLPARKSCVVQATATGELDIEIPYTSAAQYGLDVVLAPVAQGSSGTPMAIAAPFSGQVDTTASYYVITGLVPNWDYTVSATTTSNTGIVVMAGSSTSLSPYSNTNTGRTDGSGSLFIKVDGSGTGGQGAWFTLDYVVSNNPEGSVASPLDISSSSPSAPHAGQVDDRTSYYTISGLTAGSYYMAHIGENTRGVTLTVWDTNTFSGTPKCSTLSDNHCLAPAPVSGTLYISVAGDPSYITGTTYKLWLAPSLVKAEGSSGAPISITPGTPRASQVGNYPGANTSYYVVSALPAGTAYTVALANTTDDVDLSVYSDAAYSAELCHSLRQGLYDESCVATTVSGGAANKTLYITVTSPLAPATYDGASYTLSVTQGGTPLLSQGAAGAPLDITASLPYAGHVRSNGASYYKVTGLNPASTYSVIAENPSEGLDVYVYSDAAFSVLPPLCADASSYLPANRSCSTAPTALGELYVKIAGKALADTSYTLKVLSAPAAQGATGAPLDVTSLMPYAGQVGGAQSYYTISGLTPGAAYYVSASALTQSGWIKAYGDAAFTSYLAQGLVDDTVVSVVANANSGGILYVLLDGSYSSGYGAFYNLAVRPAPVSEGSIATPVALTLRTPYAGQMAYLGASSYYKISGLVPHSSHRVSLRNETMSAWVAVYDSAAFTRQLCYGSTADFRVGCAAAANAAGEMYIKVGDSGGFYDVYVP